MAELLIDNEIKVYGRQVKDFPAGIAEAFDELRKTVPENESRIYYGINHCTSNGVNYIAAVGAQHDGEGKQLGYEELSINAGNYLTKTVTGWMNDPTRLIREAFASFGNNDQIDATAPLIEAYKNDDEMVCMVKLKDQ